jgi:hypothetical protein
MDKKDQNRESGFKQEGEWAEMVFQCEATRRGLIVSKPFGDNQTYDFLIDTGSKILKVQVKSTNKKVANGSGYRYRVDFCHGRQRSLYTVNDADLFAVYIVPEDTWYLIPVAEVTTIKNSFYPHTKSGRLEQWRDYWQIFSYYGS